MSFRYPAGLITAGSPVVPQYPTGVWTNQQAAPYIQNNVWGVDSEFDQTTLLLHGDGTNGAQNNTFLDSSTNNFTITRNGNTTQGTFSPFSKVDGRWGNYFDGTGDYLSVPASAQFLPGANTDFNFEAWVYLTATPGATTAQIVGTGEYGTNSDWNISINSSLIPVFYINSSPGTSVTSSTAVSLNTWNHIAVSRSGTGSNNVKLFLNGVVVAQASTNITLDNNGNNLTIGADENGDESNLTGYVSNVRLVNGSAVYTAAFTPPTSPLTAVTNTVLLTCQSNRFVDNSTNNFTITRNGDVRVTPFSPFPSTTAYSSSVNGGSGYFDGSGDYLATPSNSALSVGTGAFTFECFVYLNDVSAGVKGIVGQLTNTSATYGLNFYTNGTTLSATVQNTSGSVVSFTTTVSSGQWYHLAFVKNGSNSISAFVNGARIGNTTSTQTIDLTSFVIGRTYTNVDGNYGNNFISNVRLVKGTAVYDPTQTTLTVPTAPLTAITNTSLLCNFTNAGIIDATAKNDLETVGNAQISTTQSKFGGSSMYFDGTGDYLVTPSSPVNILGSGDFTVELWAYPSNTSSAYRALVGSENYNSTTGGWTIYQNGTAIEVWLTGGSSPLINATSSLTATTWQHIALSRASGTVRLFVNGTSVGSASNSAEWTGQRIFIGDNNVSGTDYFYNGYIDDLRITKGVARYTTNFTPPIARFPNQ